MFYVKKPLKKTFNEFYTTYETCEIVFRPIVEYLMHKHIHCPCDDENSNIVKWLQYNTDSIITYSGLPDIDMNSDEAHELMLAADMVVTNPPFNYANFDPFFIWLNKSNIEYFIFGPLLTVYKQIKECIYKYVKHIYVPPTHRSNMYYYATSSGDLKPAITCFYTSLPLKPLSIQYKPSKKQIMMYNEEPVFDRSENVPPDYDGWMYVPCTFFNYNDITNYEFDYSSNGVPGKFSRHRIRRCKKQ